MSRQQQKMLLHVCCGPCALYPLQCLLAQEYQITLFFENPNIHPQAEWQRRLLSSQQVARYYGLPLLVGSDSDPEGWAGRGQDPKRCGSCYWRRLSKTAEKAAEAGFDTFSSTLLVSPYQDQDRLTQIGQTLAATHGLTFLAEDFRPGFRQGQAAARAQGLYRQKYCGCICSLESSEFYDKIMADLATLG